MAEVRRIDRIRISVIRESLNIEPLLLNIEKSQLRCFGNVLRMHMNRLPQRVYSAQPTGRRPVGRPRRSWREHLNGLCDRLGVSSTGVQTVAADRDLWKSKVAGLKSLHERIRD